MCGCMLMHAMMNHEGHSASPQPGGAPGRQCEHCGFPLQQGYAFCPSCGMNLRAADCPACGQKVDPAWKTCAYCGSPLGEAQGQAAHH
ncbi:MAG: zinc ribbon domain-containing protein [Chloroflexi bacterium]|nr:zinc ribbon domain-containing protein [Chloroflexota bacterium]MBI3170723.1 zinc ribbon domain-containing protein [Chloroflexota bacterium]